jgi:hypothetical protein
VSNLGQFVRQNGQKAFAHSPFWDQVASWRDLCRSAMPRLPEAIASYAAVEMGTIVGMWMVPIHSV